MIAIIGSNGQLGRELALQGALRGDALLALDIDDIDIANMASVERSLSGHRLELVINAAAYTAVDRAESKPEAAFAVNCQGPKNLARFCRRANVPLIHLSTDYVFDGSRKSAYTESDAVSPLGVYGRSKAEGEAAVREETAAHIILRTAWLCGDHGSNFVKTMLRMGRQREEIRVVDDQHGSPTFAKDLAEAIWKIQDSIKPLTPDVWGTYHFCNAGETTWFEFAEAIFQTAGRYERIQLKRLVPIGTEQYPTAAARPKHSVLDCTKVEQSFGIQRRHWREALEELIERIYANVGSNSERQGG